MGQLSHIWTPIHYLLFLHIRKQLINSYFMMNNQVNYCPFQGPDPDQPDAAQRSYRAQGWRRNSYANITVKF